MKRLKSIGLAILIAIGFGIGFYQACLSRHKVTSWDEWCASIGGEDLHTKYQVAVLTFDYDSIRDDFFGKYHDSFIRDIKKQFGLQKSDFLLSQLESLKMLGAWREGTHLHAANNFVTSNDPVAGSLTFAEWVAQYKTLTDPELLKNKADMSSYEYCWLRSMNDLFDDLTLHGETDTATIPLKHAVSKQTK